MNLDVKKFHKKINAIFMVKMRYFYSKIAGLFGFIFLWNIINK